jgi:hypothetical protein
MWQRLKENKTVRGLLSWAGLFGSLGTLLCCAIPSTLVLLGFGATLASFLGNFPQLIWLSENKGLVFGFSALMLLLSFLGQSYAKAQACPIDKKEDCQKAKDWSKPLFLFSLGINVIGSFYAFVLPLILE